MAYHRRPGRVRQIGSYLPVGSDGEPEQPLTTEQYQQKMLALQTELRDWQKRWVVNDERVRYMAIAATLAIPLAGAIWRVILGRRAVPTLT